MDDENLKTKTGTASSVEASQHQLSHTTGLSEDLAKYFNSQSLRARCKDVQHLKISAGTPPRQDSLWEKKELVYDITCESCGKQYVDESASTLP